jgi:predicted dehydrogenase
MSGGSDRRLRIAFVGTGRRMRGVYLPVTRALGDILEPVGCASRERDKGEAAATGMGLPWYPGVDALIDGAKPDLIALCVPPAANVALARSVIGRKVAVLMETPISPSLSEARALTREVEAAGAIAGVAEQKPFLPLEQLKRRAIEAGAVGRVTVAHNGFRGYDYHAIAQLRAYAGGAACVRARCLSLDLPLAPFQRGDGTQNRAPVERWDFATVETAAGTLLVHEFSDAFKAAPFRTGGAFRAFGSAGTLADDGLAAAGPDGATLFAPYAIEGGGEGRAPLRMTARWSGGEAVWENPFPDHGLADDQIGLACHFFALRLAVLEGKRPLYCLNDALADLEIMAALRLSARLGGAPVRLPLSLPRVAAAFALSPLQWARVAKSLASRAARKARR